MRTLTIVSNGHGEDVVGASLATALHALDRDLELRAFPLVDDGSAYARADVPRLGPCRVMPSGGVTVHSLANLVADLRAGLLGMTVRQVAELARLRTDGLVVVGDVYAQALAAVAQARFRAVVQPLVSRYHASGPGPRRLNRYFMEGVRYPERALMRHRAQVVYTRDGPTAAWLRERGVGHARCLGNPMVDEAAGAPLEVPAGVTAIALLPGSREHRREALGIMAQALARMEDALGLVAWTGGPLPELEGWLPDAGAPPLAGRVAALRADRGARLWFVEGRFGDVLASARLALGTSGTAHEQAAAQGLPVVSFPLPPSHGRAFLANQQRLLAEALTVCAPRAEAIAAALERLAADGPERQRAVRTGPERMGPPGGSGAIARDLLARFDGVVPRPAGVGAGGG